MDTVIKIVLALIVVGTVSLLAAKSRQMDNKETKIYVLTLLAVSSNFIIIFAFMDKGGFCVQFSVISLVVVGIILFIKR